MDHNKKNVFDSESSIDGYKSEVANFHQRDPYKENMNSQRYKKSLKNLEKEN